jgi:hypothetical protein
MRARSDSVVLEKLVSSLDFFDSFCIKTKRILERRWENMCIVN